MNVTAYLAFGSNIAPEIHVPAAVKALRAHERIDVCAVSTVYRCPAMDRPDQPDFVNGVIKIETDISPRTLKFDVLRAIEADESRVRTGDAYAPRTLDLDLLLHGEAILDQDDLRLPDPDIAVRPFLAIPLAELAPARTLPGDGRTLRAIADRLDASSLTVDAALTRTLQALVAD